MHQLQRILSKRKRFVVLYGIALFLSAFLLFLIQPLLGKYILPWFGGTPAVWTTCMLFFQILLLGGYSYAHFLVGRFATRRQAIIHTVILAASLATLPILPSAFWRPNGSEWPVLRILGLLSACVGVPYLILASASPLLQSWFSGNRPGASPYRLYSLSNLGSLLAIVSYPLLIEPVFSLERQARIWSWAYCVFTILCGACSLAAWRSAGRQAIRAQIRISSDDSISEAAPARIDWILWLTLPACSSLMLLATTNQLCLDVAVIPLLWVLPLGLYLFSFILCFHSPRWYSRIAFSIALAAALTQTCVVLFGSVYVSLPLQIASYSFTLFTVCMVCHGELVRLKPKPRHLTAFYGMIAAGGALGGVLVTLAAPLLFKGYWEFHLGLLATAAVFLVVLFQDPRSPLYRGKRYLAWTVLYGALLALAISLGIQIHESLANNLEMTRGFFGVLRVLDEEPENPLAHRFTLMHGRIEHGFQYQFPDRRYWPTSYFGPGSGIGVALRYHPNRTMDRFNPGSLRVGIVGLGTATMASYGRAGDYFRFYEVNPDVVRLCRRYFTYLGSCPAKVDIVLGDARISMEQERMRGEIQQFDILAVDAFSSDAIPVHLLTRECLEIYHSHLGAGGILALHLSSRYFDLAPVARGLASLDPEGAVQALRITAISNQSQGVDASDWVLLTSNRQFLNSAEVRRAVKPWSQSDRSPQLWTDGHNNLFRLLIRRVTH
jgi:hypothetical protein